MAPMLAAPTRAERVSGTCGLLLIAIGGLVLLGWVTGTELLTRVLPTLPAMRPLTAVGFIGTGMALALLRPASLTADRVLGRWLGMAVALLGGAIMAEHLVGGLGVAGLLFGGSSEGPVALPAPHAALGMLLSGSALWATDRQIAGGRLARFAVIAVWALAITALIGYAYQVDFLRALDSSSGVAIHTVLGLLVAAIGLAFLRPGQAIVGYLHGTDTGARMARLRAGRDRYVPYGEAAPANRNAGAELTRGRPEGAGVRAHGSQPAA